MPRHKDFNVITLVNLCLSNTGDSLDTIMEEKYPDMDWMGDMTQEELLILDSKVFNCSQCGHWFRQEQRDTDNENEWTCLECK